MTVYVWKLSLADIKKGHRTMDVRTCRKEFLLTSYLFSAITILNRPETPIETPQTGAGRPSDTTNTAIG